MHGYALTIVATDALVLKHEAINIHGADKMIIIFRVLFIVNNITIQNYNLKKEAVV